MPITPVTNVKSPYLLVHVGWGGDRYYRVVPIKKDLKKAWKLARELDESLKQRQAAYRQLQKMSPQRFLHPEGKIVGVRINENRRRGRPVVVEFKLRVVRDGKAKPAFTSISITKHGFDKAFELMLNAYAEFAGIEKNSSAFTLLERTREVYRSLYEGREPPKIDLELKDTSVPENDDHATWLSELQAEIEQFRQKQTAQKAAAKKPAQSKRRPSEKKPVSC